MNTREKKGWRQYHRITAKRPPRELLRTALQLVDTSLHSSRMAVDLGCGAGVESLELLRQGWSVLAIDVSRSAIQQLRSAVSAKAAVRLGTLVSRAENVQLPLTDLIWAGLSLPFVSPQVFPGVWQAILDSLKPGGIFAGDFFGRGNAWARNATMTFHTAQAVRQLCRPLVIGSFVTERGRRMTMNGIIRWHAFGVIARKPPLDSQSEDSAGSNSIRQRCNP